jgi:hypothetical protein
MTQSETVNDGMAFRALQPFAEEAPPLRTMDETYHDSAIIGQCLNRVLTSSHRKPPFSVHSAHDPPKLTDPTLTQAFLAHRHRPHQNSVLVTTRFYLPEVYSPEVIILPYDIVSNMENVRQQKNWLCRRPAGQRVGDYRRDGSWGGHPKWGGGERGRAAAGHSAGAGHGGGDARGCE